MNVEALQLVQAPKVKGASQTTTSSKDFVNALKQALINPNEENNEINELVEMKSNFIDIEGLLAQLNQLVSQFPNSEAFLSEEILQSVDVQMFLSELPEDLVLEISQMFKSGISLDEIVASDNFIESQAMLSSALIVLAQKDLELLHKGTSNQTDRAHPFLQLKNEGGEPIQQELLRKINALVEQLSQNKNGKTSSPLNVFSVVNKEEILQTSFAQLKTSVQGKSLPSQFFTGVGTTMSPVQQLVIHVGDSNQHLSQQQFIRQFEEILGRSSLLNLKNGTSQLSIKLYPEHLGRLDVSLTQMNGMMIAKIMTTSNSAKELIESQLHQLRQAFASQQINIERIEISQQPLGQSLKDSSNQQSNQQSEQHESNENDEEKQSNIADQQFSDLLEEMTINEKA